mgnify:CR=1 FL=1
MLYNILDTDRKKLLPFLTTFKQHYYLAGGTGLALQIGHRKSEDFDFFTLQPFSTTDLFDEVQKYLVNRTLVKIQEEKNTLIILVNDVIKISFFYYPYPLLEPLLEQKSVKIASVVDIGCMKLSAIVSRATLKDYVDLYFILKSVSLKELLEKSKQKHPTLDTNLVLKSLIYFDDVDTDPMEFMPDHIVSFDQVKTFLTQEVKKYFGT